MSNIVSSAVSQAPTQQKMQQIGNNPPLANVENLVPYNITTAQQVQSPIKFDVPAFEDDSAASWLRWSYGAVYQARGCGFETELAAAERERLSVGAGVFDSSNVAWMTRINSCRGIALEIMQRSEVPNDVW